jgi:hypothetical protein
VHQAARVCVAAIVGRLHRRLFHWLVHACHSKRPRAQMSIAGQAGPVSRS